MVNGTDVNKVTIGDCRETMRRWVEEGLEVQMCVTSPPYFGLRDYGTAEWKGGDPNCDHDPNYKTSPKSTLGGGKATQESAHFYRGSCGKCGARRVDRQIGLEPTITRYVDNLVEVFRLVRDLLANDGTLWLNLGDTYAGNGGYSPDAPSNKAGSLQSHYPHATQGIRGDSELRPKNLCGIPWRVAFALQADGWILRQDIIWSKVTAMPESITDRCTKAHEYLFLLSKRPRYYYDAAAIAEPSITEWNSTKTFGVRHPKTPDDPELLELQRTRFAHNTYHPDIDHSTRNKRSVWTIPTVPYTEAHFAVFPSALVEPCVLAGSRIGDVVLDPFMGSGTVARVAQDLGRKWIGCELNPKYGRLVIKRAAQQRLVSYEGERPRIIPKVRRLIK